MTNASRPRTLTSGRDLCSPSAKLSSSVAPSEIPRAPATANPSSAVSANAKRRISEVPTVVSSAGATPTHLGMLTQRMWDPFCVNVTSRQTGILQIAVSGFFFGSLGFFGKSVFQNGVTPGELLSLRFTLAALVLWPAVWVLHPREWRLPLTQIAACAALGYSGYALFSSCFFMALSGLSASLTVLMLYTYPVMVAGAAWILWAKSFREASGWSFRWRCWAWCFWSGVSFRWNDWARWPLR